MKVKLHHRENCRLCDSKNIELVVKLEPIPPQEKYVETSELAKKIDVFPVDLYMCLDCGHVQQLDILDSDTLWDGYTYLSGKAKGMVEHFSEVSSDVIETYEPSPNSLVIDVGSNDGSLLRPFKMRGYKVLGIDPAKELARSATESGIETLPDILSYPLAQDIVEKYGKASVITAFNAFAHADDLGDMAKSIQHMLESDGIFIFEVQYLLDVIDKMLIGSIFHEHMSHHSLKPMKQFLARYGMEIINIERAPIQHGSLIGTVQLIGGKRQVNPSVENLLKLERERKLDKLDTVKGFADNLRKLREDTSKLISEWNQKNASVAGYGAARSGQTLISQLGLHGIIEYIVDDHPQKIYKYPAGDGIQVLPTEELYNKMPDYTVILAWVHADKIIEKNQDYLNRGGKFVVLCPEIKVVSNDVSNKVQGVK